MKKTNGKIWECYFNTYREGNPFSKDSCAKRTKYKEFYGSYKKFFSKNSVDTHMAFSAFRAWKERAGGKGLEYLF
jgi:hypothetical protein